MNITAEQRTYARVAGIMILANYLLQGFGDYPTIIARRGETFAERAAWAVKSALLYRVSLLEVAAAWIAIGVLAYALYVVLEPVDKRLAQLALVLRLGASFVGAAAMGLRVAEARLYLASATPDLFTSEQLRTLVAVVKRAAGEGIEIAWMFQGAGSVLFFLLFLRSRYLPRTLAGLGVFTAALIVPMAMAMFVVPTRINELKLVGVPGFLVEVVTAFWLLFKGLPRRATANATAQQHA
jgi:hypothetical protein